MLNNNNYYPGAQGINIPPRAPIYNAPPTGLKGRPVSSIEEARAIAIDFDGMINYFPDLANNRIYTKQFQMDGTAPLKMYVLKEIPNNFEFSEGDYITREEFNNVISKLTALLQQNQQNPPIEASTPTPEQPAAKPLDINF